MTATRPVSPLGLVALAAIAAACFGAVLPSHPFEAIAVLCVTPLALCAPMACLGVILFVSVLVPFDVQNQLSVGGGAGVPGLLLVDVLLGLGLVRVAILVGLRRLALETPLLLAVGLLMLLAAALAQGEALGASASDGGTEARCALLGVGTFILAWPLLETADTRSRLYKILVALGLALGLWGIAQWLFGIQYGSAGDVGVRPGIDQIASAGGGQLQGGLYGFPLAVILSFAYLLSPAARPGVPRFLAGVVFSLNTVCVLLTYERTIWAAALIGGLVATVKTGRESWVMASRWAAIGLIGLVLITSLAGGLPSATERVTSLLRYRSDTSLQARKAESRAVIKAIRRHPVTGSGFGATITWGQADVFGTKTTSFSHDGYLWLSWKLGIPLALLIVAVMAGIATRRARPTGDGGLRAVRIGSQAALLGTLAICLTFPAFNTLGITAVLGLIAAISVARTDAGAKAGSTAA